MQFIIHMWQSCVEIEDYSITYFDCITVFEYHTAELLGGVHPMVICTL